MHLILRVRVPKRGFSRFCCLGPKDQYSSPQNAFIMFRRQVLVMKKFVRFVIGLNFLNKTSNPNFGLVWEIVLYCLFNQRTYVLLVLLDNFHSNNYKFDNKDAKLLKSRIVQVNSVNCESPIACANKYETIKEIFEHLSKPYGSSRVTVKV
jgi:hypothetical protein